MAKHKLPSWYKIVIDHGPGHQSQTIKYRYDTLEMVKYWLEDVTDRMSWPIAKIKKIKKLPPDIKKQKISQEKSNIKHARSMLKILEVS